MQSFIYLQLSCTAFRLNLLPTVLKWIQWNMPPFTLGKELCKTCFA